MDEYESLSHSQCSVAEIREQSLASFWKIESAVAVQSSPVEAFGDFRVGQSIARP